MNNEVPVLSTEELILLRTPLIELDKNGVLLAIKAKDKKNAIIRQENASHVSTLKNIHYGIMDDLGMKGVLNPADGKKYDSKSELRKSYKQHGLIEVGNELPAKERELRGDFDNRKALSQAIDQIGIENITGRKPGMSKGWK